MIKMLNAYTDEVDDIAIAVEEILEQLDLAKNQKQNMAGFISCSYDFIESGVVEAISNALPFDIVGGTTLTAANNEHAGTITLCISVLASDNCVFSAASSSSLSKGLHDPLKQAYDEAVSKLPSAPSLILAFLPMMREVGGELILNELNTVTKGVPIFGTIGCDHDTSEYLQTHTIFNTEAMRDCCCMLLISGDIKPQFYVASASEDKIQKQKAIITESDGSVLKKVNDISTMDYLKTLGLTKGDGIEGMSAIPFIVNYNDGTQAVARAIYMLTPEGYAVCGGSMPVNATLSIGAIDEEDVLLTAEQTMEKIMRQQNKNGLILFPCLGRNLVLGTDFLAEIDRIKQTIGDHIPYHLCYSGGEVCPVYDENNHPVNRFHNFTLIACVF